MLFKAAGELRQRAIGPGFRRQLVQQAVPGRGKGQLILNNDGDVRGNKTIGLRQVVTRRVTRDDQHAAWRLRRAEYAWPELGWHVDLTGYERVASRAKQPPAAGEAKICSTTVCLCSKISIIRPTTIVFTIGCSEIEEEEATVA